MSSLSSYITVSEQIKQILQALTLVYDNFIEIKEQKVSEKLTGNSEKTEAAKRSSFKSGSLKEVIKFHSSIRKGRDRASSSSSSSSSSASSATRKRSWESEENLAMNSIDNFDTPTIHTGKRSKSLVLTHQLEGLCIDNTSTVFAEMDEWADQDLKPSNNFKSIEGVEDLKRQLDSCFLASIDEILRIISSSSINHFNTLFTHYNTNNWIKMEIIHQVIESINSSEIPLKLAISRSLNLLIALNRISILLDWNDPELLFLLNKLMILDMNLISRKINLFNSTGLSVRIVMELLGMLRVLNLFSRLPIPTASYTLLISRPDISDQIIELSENLLETLLIIIEYCATSSKVILSEGFDTFNLANCSVFLALKIIEKYEIHEIDEIIKNLANRIEIENSRDMIG